jgi:hypothetical protein
VAGRAILGVDVSLGRGLDETRLFSWMTAGFCWLGDVREGVIVLPAPAVEEGYRRCLPPGGSPRSAEARLCECGCGAPVRRRFLPGHDARLKSRLLKDLRAGESAARELARLGWHPGEDNQKE